MLISAVQIPDGHILEKLYRVLPDRRIRGHQRQIRVHGRRLLIIITASDLRDILDLTPAAVSNQTDLRVHLIRLKSIDHTASGLLHPFGPVDIILLVEPGPKLDQHGHILPVLRSRTQVFNQPCLLRKTVDRDLDGHNIGIHRSFLDHLKERIHTLIRIEQQNVLLLYLAHHAAVLYMS